MTQNRIIDLAREAGMPIDDEHFVFQATRERVTKFAHLVRNAALEEAAVVANNTVCDTHLPTGIVIYGTRAGAAIRALKLEGV